MDAIGKPYFRDDSVVIFHADCRDILPKMPKVDLVLTDPPYGVTYQSNHRVGQGSTPISNDGTRLSLRLYRDTLALFDAAHVLWFTRWDAWPDVWEILGSRFPLRGLLVWDKGHPGMGDLKHWGPSYELIASAGYGETIGSRDCSVLAFSPVPPARREHPTEKPAELLSYLIRKLDAQTILDPFMGSGTTLRAAKDLGRYAVGIEIELKYCQIAAKRMSQTVMAL